MTVGCILALIIGYYDCYLQASSMFLSLIMGPSNHANNSVAIVATAKYAGNDHVRRGAVNGWFFNHKAQFLFYESWLDPANCKKVCAE